LPWSMWPAVATIMLMERADIADDSGRRGCGRERGADRGGGGFRLRIE
jgi:hypothetical protein